MKTQLALTCPVLVPTAMVREPLNFSALIEGKLCTLARKKHEKYLHQRKTKRKCDVTVKAAKQRRLLLQIYTMGQKCGHVATYAQSR